MMKGQITPVMRIIYFGIGGLMVILGVIGLFLPVMPTVPFLILAAWCFQRSSPRFHQWLYQHKLFGPQLKKWDERGAIGTLPKIWAVCGMGFGLVIFYILILPPYWLMLLLSFCLLAVALYIVTRPTE